MTGGAVGIIVHGYAPFPTADPGAYALVGMGTLFAGIIRAPMTSVFMIFEITQDYEILVPLMVANMLSYVIARHYQPTSVYHALLRQDNVHLPSTGGTEIAPARTARDVMRSDVESVAPGLVIDAAAVHVHPDHALDIVFERLAESDGMLPVVSRSDARRIEGVVTVATITASLGRRPVARTSDS
jgi:CIC family chloride channel protein